MKTIYYNGKVYTGMLPLASAFIEEDGKILCTGSDDECLSCADSETEKIDLSGKFVTSSFNDSHMHVLSYGHALTMAKLDEHTDSLEGMLSYLKEFAEQNTPENGMWLLGRGWNQDYFSDVNREPNRYDLDRM